MKCFLKTNIASLRIKEWKSLFILDPSPTNCLDDFRETIKLVHIESSQEKDIPIEGWQMVMGLIRSHRDKDQLIN